MTSTYATAHLRLADTGEQSTYPLDTPAVPAEHTRAYRRLYAAGAALFVAGIIVGLNYAYLTIAPASLRYALLALSAVLLTLSGVAIIWAWDRQVATDALHRQTLAEVHQLREQVHTLRATISNCAGELRELPEQVRHELRTLPGQLQIALDRAVDDRVAPVERRVGALEARPDATQENSEADDTYLMGYADGLAGRMSGEAKVLSIASQNGHHRDS